MKLNGKLGPPIGAAVGLVLGIWTAATQMLGYTPVARLGMPIVFATIGLFAGFIVWWLDHASTRQSADVVESDQNCCPRCGRRNAHDATECIKCGVKLPGRAD